MSTSKLNISIYCTDYPPPILWLVSAYYQMLNACSFGLIPKHHVLSYSKKDDSAGVIAIPDFLFWNWPQVGISSFDETAYAISDAGLEKPNVHKLFWIGAASHRSRKALLALRDQHALFDFREIIWDRTDVNKLSSESYVSLVDHTRYQYLLDVEGNGYSARVKLLMFSRRPLFLQDRPYKEYFFAELRPFFHYIPVENDFSDLVEKLDWAEANPEKTRAVADQAYAYAVENFSTEKAIEKLSQIVEQLTG